MDRTSNLIKSAKKKTAKKSKKSIRKKKRKILFKTDKLIKIIISEKTSCPYCKSKKILKWGKQSLIQRYQCRSCKRTFNQYTSTPLKKLKRKELWLGYAVCLEKGLSLRKSANLLGVSVSTLFRWKSVFVKL